MALFSFFCLTGRKPDYLVSRAGLPDSRRRTREYVRFLLAPQSIPLWSTLGTLEFATSLLSSASASNSSRGGTLYWGKPTPISLEGFLSQSWQQGTSTPSPHFPIVEGGIGVQSPQEPPFRHQPSDLLIGGTEALIKGPPALGSYCSHVCIYMQRDWDQPTW